MFFFTSHPGVASRRPAPASLDSSQGGRASPSPLLGWLLLALVAAAWLMPGIIGHGPWKQDETYTFGIIHHMLSTGEYLVPTNAGEPFMEKPPLYYWTATWLAHALAPWLEYHDGARMASVLFNLITLGFVARIALLMWPGQRLLSWPVLGTLALFAGSPGMVKHAHDMFTDVALVCGAAMATCGLLEIALQQQRRAKAVWPAICFGLGVGVAQMSKGLFVPLIFGATAVGVGVLVPQCRSRAYLRQLGLALLVSAPFFLIWPALLAQHSMPLFMEWFWDNNVGRFFGFSVSRLGSDNDHTVILRALGGFALPGAVLTLATLARCHWSDIANPRVALPLCFVVISIAVLQSSATARQLYLLPVLLPLVMAGCQAVPRLPGWLHIGWDWFSRIFFGALAVAIWGVWAVSIQAEEAHGAIAYLGKWLPLDFVTPIEPLSIAAAMALCLGWLWALNKLALAGKWRGALSWFAGITLMWGLAFTLLLPWADYAKSYEYVYDELEERLTAVWQPGDCMASQDLGESEAPMLHYYAGVLHQRLDQGPRTQCRWLIQGIPEATALPEGQWLEFWEGQRDGDARQLLRVYRRVD